MVDRAAYECAQLMLPLILESRMPETNEAIKVIEIMMKDREGLAKETQKAFEDSLDFLKNPRDQKNSFLAFLRELGGISSDQAIIFGMKISMSSETGGQLGL